VAGEVAALRKKNDRGAFSKAWSIYAFTRPSGPDRGGFTGKGIGDRPQLGREEEREGHSKYNCVKMTMTSVAH